MEQLRLLEARVDVMQREIRQVLTTVNADLEQFFGGVMKALEAMDARIQLVENRLRESASIVEAANTEIAPTVERPSGGKEL